MEVSLPNVDVVPAALQTLRVVLVEDNPVDAELIVRELRRSGFNVDWTRVETEPEYLAALDTAPDLIIADHSLPHFNGLLAVDLLRERGLEVPFILVSGTIGEEQAVLSIQRGADDYLLKDRLSRLGPAVRRALEVRRSRQEHNLATVALLRSEHAYRELVQSLPVAMYRTDVDGRITLFNEAAVELWGRRPDSERDIFDCPLELFDLEGNPIPTAHRPTARALRENRGFSAVEYLLQRDDATRRQVLAYPHPVVDEDGALTGAVSLMIDVTDLKQAQRALLASEAFAQATIDSVSAHICVLDESAKIIAVNLAWREFFRNNHPQPEQSTAYLGSNYLEVCESAFGPDGPPATAMAAGIRQVMAGSVEEFILEYPCHSPAEQRWFVTRVTRFRDASRNIVIAHENTTERKLQEHRLLRMGRVRAMLSAINATIARVRKRQDLLDGACQIACDEGHYAAARIRLLERASGRILPASQAGVAVGAREELLMSGEEGPSGELGLSRRAVRSGQPQVINDLQSDSLKSTLYERQLAAGIRAIVSLPLVIGGEAVGVFNLYSAEANVFDVEEMKLLAELAADVSFGLDHLHKTEQLEYLAYYDALTGLPNRALLVDRMAQQFGIARHNQSTAALVLLDLEHFRHLNATLGRSAADGLLREMAARLVECTFERDSVARMQGDVFAVLIADVAQADEVARIVEDKIIRCMEAPLAIAGDEVRVRVRAGIALFQGDATSGEGLLNNAEAALRQAKTSSERFLFHAPEMNVRLAEKVAMEHRLHRALERAQFVLHYQPKFDLQTRQITGLEALIRWQDPDSGMVPPGLFIGALEETGLIVEVGAWVMHEVVAQQERWRAAGIRVPRVAVNVSQVQLRRGDFLARVQKAIAAAPAEGHGLDLEITESMIMEDISANIATLEAIRGLGSEIAIDDFGTGYSSLQYLARLPINSLKIDRAFVNRMAVDPKDMAMVSTIVSLAHSLGLKVIAEGVETEEQAKLLQLLRCDEAQGYLLGRPVPVDQITRLLAGS